MEKYLIVAGVVLNCFLIVANRYWKKFPDWLYLPGLIVAVLCIFLGMFLSRN